MPGKQNSGKRTTRVVSEEVFKQVYDSPHSLPGKAKWVTSHEDVRKIEEMLGMKPKTIGAPLWVSGDTRNCPHCGRETNWLDIVASALSQVHAKALLVTVILGDKKYVNVEAPHAIQDLFCYQCNAAIPDLRSFKCHNWAYARQALLEVIEEVNAREAK